jgi:glucose/arabinose dehydrogenase
MKKGLWGLLAPMIILFSSGCYVLHHSSGGGQTGNHARHLNPQDVALPPGYRLEIVTTNLTFPTGVTFDQDGRPCVVESGYSYGEVWTTPRLLRIEQDGRHTILATGARNGPWNGVTFHEGNFYVAEGGEWSGGRILKINSNGQTSVLVDNLPSLGDHHTDGPVVGPDGWLYFGQGTASNSGIVGEDNADFGWLKRHPEFHDIPGEDVVLSGLNYESKDVVHGSRGKVLTGAFLPFGTPARSNQVVRGQLKCGGSILRVRPSGGDPELVAWGFRNPFGLAFSADGKLFVTENGFDDRGSRPVWGAADVLWQVEPKLWYGWPDYSAGQPLTDKMFKAPGHARLGFLLAKHPNQPPQPAARFGVHSSADGLDFSRNPSFGHVGEAFVALFGDQAPTVGKVLAPVGFSVVRVNVRNGAIEPFAMNKGKKNGPASRLQSGGLERPLAVRFNPAADALYVVDFGVLNEENKTSIPWQGTGVLWRITKDRP